MYFVIRLISYGISKLISLLNCFSRLWDPWVYLCVLTIFLLFLCPGTQCFVFLRYLFILTSIFLLVLFYSTWNYFFLVNIVTFSIQIPKWNFWKIKQILFSLYHHLQLYKISICFEYKLIYCFVLKTNKT